MSARNRRPALLAAVWGAALLLTAAPARAQENKDLQELRARLEKLEKQNEELRRLLEKQTEKADPAKPSASPEAVEKIVGEYLKKQDEKKQKADAEKKKEADDKGFEVGKTLNMNVRWDHGLWAETPDRAFRVHVGGRTQVDAVWLNAERNLLVPPNPINNEADGVNFRRARLAVEGTLWEVIDFNMEYDFLNTFNAERTGDPLTANTPAPTDLWVTFTHLPWVGNVRVGNQKQHLSFEHLTSSRYLNFLERSYAFDAFIGGLDNGFRPGIQVFNNAFDDRLFWALGVYKNNTTVFGWNSGDGELDVTGRITGLPIYANEGRCLVHVGVGASHRDLDDDQARFRARTLLRNGPAVLHTTLLDLRVRGASETLVVPELAVVWGPFSLVSEYYADWVNDAVFPANPASARVNRGTGFFQSYYVEALYFLTGEHRPYNLKTPSFTRVIPHENFFYVPGHGGNIWGKGAWQVGARYSYIDLNDNGITGGEAHSVTLGLNWFLNPNMKIQWNYVWEHRDVVGTVNDGDIHGFGTRLAIDF